MSFLLEDSTTDQVPPIVDALVSKIVSETKSYDSVQKNLIFTLIITMMFENGFLPLNADCELMEPQEINTEHLKQWHTENGKFEVNFFMCGFNNFALKLVVCPLGATVLVNLVMRELNSETYSVCLPVSRYVVSPRASTVPKIFRDLKHLSIKLKNQIISPVKSRILSYHGYASASLIGIPEEILCNIAMFLPVTDIICLSRTCKRLNYIMNKEDLWHSIYKRDFDLTQTVTTSWKLLYKAMFVKKQDENLRQTNRQAGTMHDYMDYSDFVSYVDNPMWGFIL